MFRPARVGAGGLGLDGRVTLTDIAHGWNLDLGASEMRHDDGHDDVDEKKRTCGTL